MLDRLRKLFQPRSSTLPIASVMFLHHVGDYDGPFHVSPDWSGEPAAQCVRLSDGRLHVIHGGSFPDLLCGPGYILASCALADVLRDACGRSIEVAAAQVINVATGETLARNHFEVLAKEELTPETVHTVDATGARAWHFRRSHLFVTKMVALELQRAGFTSLRFECGFSGFGGG